MVNFFAFPIITVAILLGPSDSQSVVHGSSEFQHFFNGSSVSMVQVSRFHTYVSPASHSLDNCLKEFDSILLSLYLVLDPDQRIISVRNVVRYKLGLIYHKLSSIL